MAQQNDDIMDDGAAGGNAVRVEPGVEGDHQDERSDVSSEVFGEDAVMQAAARAAEITQKQKDDKEKDGAEQGSKLSSSPADTSIQ